MAIHAYANGMAEYRKLNNRNSKRLEIAASLDAIYGEAVEAFSDLKACHFVDLCFELFGIIIISLRIYFNWPIDFNIDVWHTIVVSSVTILFPCSWLQNSLIWYPVYFMSGVITAKKHGERYLDHNCIRSSRNCKSLQHKCRNK